MAGPRSLNVRSSAFLSPSFSLFELCYSMSPPDLQTLMPFPSAENIQSKQQGCDGYPHAGMGTIQERDGRVTKYLVSHHALLQRLLKHAHPNTPRSNSLFLAKTLAKFKRENVSILPVTCSHLHSASQRKSLGQWISNFNMLRSFLNLLWWPSPSS